jgi:hydroxymethylbilane synthase
MRKVIIGSRGSDLALWQANFVQNQFQELGVEAEIKIIKTQGDNFFNRSFSKLEGKGFFTKELEEELLEGKIDLAVHSLKDLPTQSTPGLKIAALSHREDASELLLIHPDSVSIQEIFALPPRAKVGTSSPRRASQLLSHRPDFDIQELRGNVPTRVQKLRDGDYDPKLLPNAVIKRLGLDLTGIHVEELSPIELIPAPGQGVLALQIRENDPELEQILQSIHHPEVEELVGVERSVLSLFEGGCHLPLGVYCKKESGKYMVWVSKADTPEIFPDRLYLAQDHPENLAQKVFELYSKKESKIQSVFITRELNPGGYLQNYLNSKNIRLEGKSLIRTFPIIHKMDSSIFQNVDWIFFNSKNGVEYFFALEPQLKPDIKIGVIGRGSATALREFGREADFIGETSDTTRVARKFASLVEGKTVLFPQSKDSLRTIQNGLDQAITKTIDLPLYETEAEKNVEIFYSDILIFTSPSNVDSFMAENLIEPGQKVIAIGKSTAAKIREYQIEPQAIPYTPDEMGLAEAIFGMI